MRGGDYMKQEKLISARLKASLTQAEVAKKLGISRSFYTQIENSTRKPTVNLLFKMSNFFKVPVDKIFFVDR